MGSVPKRRLPLSPTAITARITRVTAFLRTLAACALLAAPAATAQDNDVPMAIPSPNGDTSFVGGVDVYFPVIPLVQRGKIFYTLDGTVPTQNSIEYKEAFRITATTTLKSVRIRSGERSQVHSAAFVKRKFPAPVISYEGKPEFTGSKKVSLFANVTPAPSTPPKIYYSTAGMEAAVLYNPAVGVTITKTCRLSAMVQHPDYDNSPIASVDFTLLIPVEKPVITQIDTVFQTKNFTVDFKSPTPNSYTQYVLGTTANIDSGTIAGSVVLVGNTPGEVITLRVIAKSAAPNMAPSEIVTRRFTYKPRTVAPAINPTVGFFHDTLTISLSTTSPGAAMYYTLDGSQPTQQKRPYAGPFVADTVTVDSVVTIRAIAYTALLGESTPSLKSYVLRLSPPVPSHPAGEFQNSLKLTLSSPSPKAEIHYSLDGSAPKVPYHGAVLELSADTTDLRVQARVGTVNSPVARHLYYRKSSIQTTTAPVITPPGRDFLDSVKISLSNPDPAAAIYYSIDAEPRRKYEPGKPILLYKTAALSVVSVKAPLDSSPVLTEHYTLIPSPPTASPYSADPYPNRVEVSLSTRTEGAVIKYILDEAIKFNDTLAFTYTKPLVFSVTEKSRYVLKAAAVVGSGASKRVSQVLELAYNLYAYNAGDVLPAGGDWDLTSGVHVANKGSSAVPARLGSFDLLDLKGFKDPSHTVTITPAAGQPAPSVEFTRPAAQAYHAVYKVVNGKAVYVSNGPAVAINQPGTYFVAADTSLPTISVISETPAFGEATAVKLRVLDNVSGPSCVIEGSGLAGKTTYKPDVDGYFTFSLRNPAGGLRDLWFNAVASDNVNSAKFPAKGDRFTVVQAWSKLTTPEAWSMGWADSPYDLAGFPIDASASLTWAQVRKDNPDPALTAVIYRDGEYVRLQDSDPIKPGMAFWLGTANARSNLALAKFQSSRSAADGRFRVALKPGWNLVTNPSLETMYWPSSHRDPKYGQYPVRGLWGWPNGVHDYVESDSLEPWNGYWVLNLAVDRENKGIDTVVELLAAKPSLPKRAAESDQAKVEILLDYGRTFPLRLGARAYARDEVGIEDEPLLPGWKQARQGWSARNRDRLMTDVLRFSQEQVMRWTVVVEGAPAAGRDSLVSVREARLPLGFEAWAWSRTRNLKLRLDAGAAYSLPGAGSDTLVVFAGPAAKLAGLVELSGAVESVDAFTSGTARDRLGHRLLLNLPTDARVTAELWSMDGRRLELLHSGILGSGQHRIPVPAPLLSREIAIIRLKAQGEGWRESRVHRIVR